MFCWDYHSNIVFQPPVCFESCSRILQLGLHLHAYEADLCEFANNVSVGDSIKIHLIIDDKDLLKVVSQSFASIYFGQFDI